MLDLDLTNDSEGGIEAGEHVVSIAEASVHDTKAGTGEYIKAKLQTANGQFIWHMFNIKNPNEVAQKIGRGQLKKMLRVAGKSEFKLTDVNELVGLRCVVRVKVEDGDYGPQARIVDFKPAPAKAETPFG